MRLFREATEDDETGLGMVVVPATDADLASLGYVKLDGINTEALKAGQKAYRRDDHLTAALKWASTIRQVLAALDQENTDGT